MENHNENCIWWRMKYLDSSKSSSESSEESGDDDNDVEDLSDIEAIRRDKDLFR